MHYFQALQKRVEELDKLAQPYLENRPQWSMMDLAAEMHKLAWKIFEENGCDFEKVDEYVANIVDGHIPFCFPSRNGSIKYALGLSLASQEAHAWNLYDYLQGKVDKPELDFEIVADVE